MNGSDARVDEGTGRDGYEPYLCPPASPLRHFVDGGCTYQKLYLLAGKIFHLADKMKAARPWLCLCTHDKSLIMASLISALAGGPRLIFPYALSGQAIREICDAQLPDLFLSDQPAAPVELHGLKWISPQMLPEDEALPATVYDPDDPFLILFTGGSTDKPKLWAKTPRNMLGEARYQVMALGISPDDVFLPTVPPNHIYGLLFSVLVPFVGSARVLDGIYAFPREITNSIEQFRATVLVSVPAHYRVLRTDALQRFELRMALSSAGTLAEEDALSFHERTGLDVVEIYGSTETGGIATRRRFVNGEGWHPMEPVAWKIREGKLCVSSVFLSPTLPRGDDGFFMTADCVEPDGDHRFLLRGRVDDIVKIGGKRVDLSAVQAKLKQIPGVRDAVVVAVPIGKGRQNELAALVATDLAALQVKRKLAQVSEAYAVPRRWLVVDDIPMTPSGKYARTEIEKVLRKGNQKKRVEPR